MPAYLEGAGYFRTLEDSNMPSWLRAELWSILSPANAHAYLKEKEFYRMKAHARVNLFLYLMSLPPRIASQVLIHIKQADYYNTLLLTRSINGWERASIVQTTPVVKKEEKKKGLLGLFGW